MTTTDDEGPLGATLAMWEHALKERELGAGIWSVADLHALILAVMKRDASLVCYNCAEAPESLYQAPSGDWMHKEVEAVDGVGHRVQNTQCPASEILLVITEMEKARR